MTSLAFSIASIFALNVVIGLEHQDVPHMLQLHLMELGLFVLFHQGFVGIIELIRG